MLKRLRYYFYFYLGSLSFAIIINPNLNAQTSNKLDSLHQTYLSERDPERKAESYYQWAYELLIQTPETGLKTADTLYQMAAEAKDERNLSRAEYLRGYSYTLQGRYKDALPHHRLELIHAKASGNQEILGKALNSYGNCFHNMGQNDSAIVYLLQAATVKEQIGNLKDIASAYANIGNVFSDEKAPDKAIEYLEKALQIRLKLPDDPRSAIFTYNNLSVAYGGRGDHDKAIEYAEEGYRLSTRTGNRFLAGVLAGNLSELWLRKGELDKAIRLADSSVLVLNDLNRKANVVYPYSVLGEAWLMKGDPAKALALNRQGFKIMEELDLGEPLTVYYRNFANAYEALGNYQEAIFWLKKYMVLDDSLFNKEKISAIAEAEAKYETEKKEGQLVRQQLELERSTSKLRSLLLGSLTIIIALGAVFLYFRNKQRIRQKEAEVAAEKASITAEFERSEALKLREMDAMKSAFFANISHEFRTPLTLIISPVDQMIRGEHREDWPKYLRMIKRNASRLLTLVNQLLELVKLESGYLKLQLSESDLSAHFRSIVTSYESLAAQKDIELEINSPEVEFPAFFDKEKLDTILHNLLSNAFKFTHEGGRVSASLSQAGAFAKISVCDTGDGMTKEQLEKLFQRFSSTTYSSVQLGSGIGLALVKELVLLHGGSIDVKSTLGGGTAFMLTVAVDQASLDKSNVALHYQSKPNSIELSKESYVGKEEFPVRLSPAPELTYDQKPVLLLVEDNFDVRDYILDSLRTHFQVLVANNGEEGMKVAEEHIPDLIITDIMMPVMDGLTFCQQIRSQPFSSHIPVIMLTARADQVVKWQGLENGANDYLVKPFDVKELILRLTNLIDQRARWQSHFRQTVTGIIPSEVKAESLDSLFLKQVKDAVEGHLDDDLFGVVELGRLVGFSRSQLHRKLTALTGQSPNEVIRHIRLEHARQLLTQKAGNVSDIAYRCGFSSSAYFVKCFRDQFGTTPGEFLSRNI